MSGRLAGGALLLAALAGACGGEERPEAGSSVPELEPLVRVDGLEGPESVARDGRRGRWLVVGGGEAGRGGGGYLAAVPARGDTGDRHARDAGPAGLRLDAPRGIVVRGDTAWIADLRRVVAVDLAADSVLFELVIEGGERLDDLARGVAGPLFVSDARADAIWRVATDGSGQARVGAVGSLRGPDGLLAEDLPSGEARLVVAGSEGAVLTLDADSSVTMLAGSPSFRRLDGLQLAPDGALLVGDRETGRIHHLRRPSPEVWRTGDPWLTDLEGPADFAVVDSLLALPEAGADRLTVYRVVGG